MTFTNAALADDSLLFKVRRLVGENPKLEQAAIVRIRSRLDEYLEAVRAERTESVTRRLRHMEIAKAVYLQRAALEAEAADALRDTGGQVAFKLRVPRNAPAWLRWCLTEKDFIEGEDGFGEEQLAICEYYVMFADEDQLGLLDPKVNALESIIARAVRLDPETAGDEEHYREVHGCTDLHCADVILYSHLHDMILEYLGASKAPRRYPPDEWWEILVVCRIWLDNEFKPQDSGLPEMVNWDDGQAWEHLRLQGDDSHQLLMDLVARAIAHIEDAASPARVREDLDGSATDATREVVVKKLRAHKHEWLRAQDLKSVGLKRSTVQGDFNRWGVPGNRRGGQSKNEAVAYKVEYLVSFVAHRWMPGN